MEIQVEKIWLFETEVADPFFLGAKDGVTVTMDSPRVIELLDLVTVYFLIEGVGQGGLSYTMKYGGEDTDILASYGKSSTDYSVAFNMPTKTQKIMEEMIGKQFSLVGMRRDLTLFCIFGQFEADNHSIDNEVQKRVTFKARNSNAKMFSVKAMNIETIENLIDDTDFEGGFDYGFDFGFS